MRAATELSVVWCMAPHEAYQLAVYGSLWQSMAVYGSL
jgi:hypothetical protein